MYGQPTHPVIGDSCWEMKRRELILFIKMCLRVSQIHQIFINNVRLQNQQPTCVGITGAIQICPTTVMENLTSFSNI